MSTSADRTALAQVVDLRLADLWRELFEVPREQWDVELIGWFLRAAYGQGYTDAQQEIVAGELQRQLADARAQSAARFDAPVRGTPAREAPAADAPARDTLF